MVSNKGNRIAYIKTVAGVVLLVQCCVLFELIDEKGGSVGKAIAVRLVPAIGKVGTYVVVIILMVICVVLITEKSILKGMKIGGEKADVYKRQALLNPLTERTSLPLTREGSSFRWMSVLISIGLSTSVILSNIFSRLSARLMDFSRLNERSFSDVYKRQGSDRS